MGISNQLSLQLDSIFNRWTKVKVTDPELLRLIQLAMVPNKEVLDTCFNNMCNSVFEYAMSSPTQQTETTKGTLFGAYNAVTGYFQNVRNYRDDESKLKSLLYGGTAQIRTQKAFHLCTDFLQGELAGLVN